MTVRSVLFEDFYTLVAILLTIDIVALLVWARRRTPRSARAVLVGMVATPVLLIVQAWVVTDAERVAQACRAIAEAVGDADIAAMAAHFDESFSVDERHRRFDKPAFLEEVGGVLKEWAIEEERLAGFEVTVDGDAATAAFRSVCRLVGYEMTVPRHIAHWKLDFVRRGGAWRVRSVEHLRQGASPTTLIDFLR